MDALQNMLISMVIAIPAKILGSKLILEEPLVQNSQKLEEASSGTAR